MAEKFIQYQYNCNAEKHNNSDTVTIILDNIYQVKTN